MVRLPGQGRRQAGLEARHRHAGGALDRDFRGWEARRADAQQQTDVVAEVDRLQQGGGQRALAHLLGGDRGDGNTLWADGDLAALVELQGAGQRLGLKKSGGQTVFAGQIIARQRGTKWRAGPGVAKGRDHTLYAARTGELRFAKPTHLGKKTWAMIEPFVDEGGAARQSPKWP